MTYSCAYFKNKNDTLEDAQLQKYEHICRKLHLKEGETLVDIGCGWGGMLLYAARRYGVKCLGCTLSAHQAEYAKKRVTEEGLGGNITILLEDYRNIKGQFDKFVSIGMFEHVGKSLISTFIDRTKAMLKPGGIGLLHTIGKERNTPFDPWTMKYVFPGGHLPVLDHVIRAMGKKGLVPIDIENLRLHYAATSMNGPNDLKQMWSKSKTCLIKGLSERGACISAEALLLSGGVTYGFTRSFSPMD